MDIEKLYMCQPDSGEMALEVVDNLVRSGAFTFQLNIVNGHIKKEQYGQLF